MKFNPNQRYTRWSIRRLSVGVASVVVASGFFVLVGQPSSVRADVVNPTPAQVVPDADSVSEKSNLPAEVLKEAIDTALPSEQADSTPKASLDTASSPEKADAGAKEPVVAPKEEAQAKPESKKQTEDAVKPVESPAATVAGQDPLQQPLCHLDEHRFCTGLSHHLRLGRCPLAARTHFLWCSLGFHSARWSNTRPRAHPLQICPRVHQCLDCCRTPS